MIQEIKDFIKWANTQSNWITIPEKMADDYMEYKKYKESTEAVKNNAVLPLVTDTFPHQVIAWLGQYRDKLPQEAINSLQDMCGY